MAIEVVVGLHTETQFFSGYSEDVAKGGLFVATYRPLEIGTKLDISLGMPNGAVKARGRIVWKREAHEGMAPGVGIAFESLEDEAREAIASFVSARPPLFYDV